MFSMLANTTQLAGAVLICVGLLATPQIQTSATLEREIPIFDVANVPMLLAVSKLRELGVRACFEEVELDPQHDRIFNEKQQPVGVRKSVFSLHLEKKTVREILDALTKADGGYAWKLDTNTGVINIFPASPISKQPYAGSVLNWIVERLDTEGKGRLVVLQDDLNLKAHSITPFWRGSYDYYNSPISLHVKNTPLTEILNKISSAPPQLCWTLAGFKGGRILTVVPCGSP